jgi:hypothetical protein
MKREKIDKNTLHHKVHIYIEHHSVCPLVRIGPPPLLSPASDCVAPSEAKGGGTLVRGWGSGGVPIRTTGEKA